MHTLTYQRGQLNIEHVDCAALLKKYGSPLYVYSAVAIRDAYQELMRACRELPIQVCYAVKANSNLSVLSEMKRLGAGADLVSYGEWLRAEMAGIPRELRVLSGVAKTDEELLALLRFPGAGVGSIHVESTMELERIVTLATRKRKSVVVALRYNPDVDAKTHDKISTGRKQDKFGLTRDEVLASVRKYSRHALVKIQGLSIHLGSQITKLQPYEQGFKKLKQLCLEVESVLGHQLQYVDLGGGIGIQYLEEAPLSVVGLASLIKKYFGHYEKILLEPGRSLVANAGILLTTSVFTKVRGTHRTLILDAGMNDLMRPALYDVRHDLIPVTKIKSRAQSWDVVGGICETTDYFARGQKLVVTKDAGEAFAFLSCGAYGFSMSSTYNTRPRVAEVWVDGSRSKLIRKRETVADLLRHEILR